MKRICNLATIHRRDDARIFRKECFAETQRYEVHYITCDGKGYELKDNIHIYGIKKYKSKLLRAIFAPFRVYRKAKAIDADIYVLHEPELLLIALLLKRGNKCVVFDCHEYYDKAANNFPFMLRVVIIFFFKCLARFSIPYMDGNIAATEGIVDFFKKVHAKNIHILHNYAMLKDFQSVQMPDFKHRHCILFTGTFYPVILNLVRALTLCRNDIKLILRLFNASPADLNLLFHTPGFSKTDFKENVYFEQIKLLHKECFAGFVAHANFFGNVSCSSNKLQEYMANGLPGIILKATNSMWFKNFVNNDGHPLGFCIDSDPQSIADAIDCLYENEEVARTMGMNGRKAFETKYNFESEADGFLKFLEEVSQSKNQNK